MTLPYYSFRFGSHIDLQVPKPQEVFLKFTQLIDLWIMKLELCNFQRLLDATQTQVFQRKIKTKR